MPANIGYVFQPGADAQRQEGVPGSGGRSSLSPQQAVRLLSLRIPERPAPHGVAPNALLQSKGGMGAPGGGSLQAIIQALMTMFSGGGLSPAGLPSPRVVPGIDQTRTGPLVPLPQGEGGDLFGGAPPIDLGAAYGARPPGGYAGYDPNRPRGGTPPASDPAAGAVWRPTKGSSPLTQYNPGTPLF